MKHGVKTLNGRLWLNSEPGQGTEIDTKVLTVGLFRYVPDIKAFETALTAQWKNIEPDVTLRFVDWDCYFEEPKSDVFVFDGLYAPQYIEKGLLYPLGETIPALPIQTGR